MPMKNTINVKVAKNNTEPGLSLLRRFQKKVQESGIMPRVRSIRYAVRPLSDLKVKNGKLKKLAGGVEYNRLKRLGALVERKKGFKK
jgi:ribosomal protein S21